jgi:hypothetical protein
MTYDLKGLTPESWCCVDCGINTFPGCQTRIEMERASAHALVSQTQNGDVETHAPPPKSAHHYCSKAKAQEQASRPSFHTNPP